MRIIVFDTETTGFPSPALSLAEQPYIVQFGAIVLRYDSAQKKLLEEEQVDELIAVPVAVPADCTRVHGITNAMLEGRPDFPAVASKLLELFGRSDVAVAHNLDFDVAVLTHEFKRANRLVKFLPTQTFDTMKEMTDLLKIPNGRGGHKYPTLSEAYRHLFGEEFTGAHHALRDTAATVRILQALLDRGIFQPKEPVQQGLF